MPELLLELLSEDIPARMQTRAAAELKRLVTAGLEAGGLAFERADAHATPRRLALVVDGLPKRQPATRESRRGPSVDAPDAAVDGFARSVGVSRAALKTEATKKGEYYVADVRGGGRAVREVVADIVRDAIWEFSWSKSMTWGEKPHLSWVRPLQSILCVFDGRAVKFDLVRGVGRAAVGEDPIGASPHGLASGNRTCGHRFLAPKGFTVSSFDDYATKLRKSKVILESGERRALIESELKRLADAEELSVKEDRALLDEVTGLVEWPVVLLGQIDERFMDLPDEVLTTVMRRHQKYFSLLRADGVLAPRFAVVANIAAADGGAQIVAGNERVLAARLADAQFFWDQDRKRTLESRASDLRGLIFHAKLGSVADKAVRLQAMIQVLAQHVPDADVAISQRAALLAKTDLTTGMVGEFPELQGIVGSYYALQEDARPEVARAIAEHYAPLGPNDQCPNAPTSIVLALADKIDTLVGFWSIDEKPTGSRDPYALRRAALGVIRLIVENELRLPLADVMLSAYECYGSVPLNKDGEQTILELLSFIADRLVVQQREKGVRHDLIKAVFSQRQSASGGSGEIDLVGVLKRVDALTAFLNTDDGSNLLVAYQRAANIVRIEQERDGMASQPEMFNPELAEGAEHALSQSLDNLRNEVDPLLEQERYIDAMKAFSKLRKPIDVFFDQVKVNTEVEELRKNRLSLLAYVTRTMNRVADFSQIEG